MDRDNHRTTGEILRFGVWFRISGLRRGNMLWEPYELASRACAWQSPRHSMRRGCRQVRGGILSGTDICRPCLLVAVVGCMAPCTSGPSFS